MIGHRKELARKRHAGSGEASTAVGIPHAPSGSGILQPEQHGMESSRGRSEK